ncbi:MAG: FHA domain-containing protein [Blastocatellia bacterium]|nr:FHA domain-containing protein [Blastocatellia bacterium]
MRRVRYAVERTAAVDGRPHAPTRSATLLRASGGAQARGTGRSLGRTFRPDAPDELDGTDERAGRLSDPCLIVSRPQATGGIIGSAPHHRERGRIGKEFAVAGGETNIGRWDADGGIFPDVDLDQDDPEAKVSRRHARIMREGTQFFIEDLGSTNGTFINRGRRLLPGNRHPLNNGDEIIVGKTFLKFVVEGAPF